MIATILVCVVVVLHLVFALAESVGWDKMARRFGYNKEATEITRSLAMNQGAYNAGVAGLLVWAMVTGQTATVVALLVFVVVMAVVGGVTARWTIFAIQGVPALAALGATAAAI